MHSPLAQFHEHPEVLARSPLVRRYMTERAAAHRDATTGEVSAALLAAAVAHDFDLYDDAGVAVGAVLEVAAQVASAIN